MLGSKSEDRKVDPSRSTARVQIACSLRVEPQQMTFESRALVRAPIELGLRADRADRVEMAERVNVERLMPMMREYGSLHRKCLGAGVTPLEYQRWLDLERQIGSHMESARAKAEAASRARGARDLRPRLLVTYASRKSLVDSVIDNIHPAGFFVPTPFAAETGSEFVARVFVEEESEMAEVPVSVATSIVQGAHTLSTMNMGMGLKVERLTRAQAASVSKIFDRALDEILGITRRT
jgi:hypothetical protein